MSIRELSCINAMPEHDAHMPILIIEFLYVCMLLIYCLCYHHHHIFYIK
jgi:hypothetical protein